MAKKRGVIFHAVATAGLSVILALFFAAGFKGQASACECKLTIKGAVATPGSAQGVHASVGLAFVADDDSGLQVIDAADPTQPAIVGSYLPEGYLVRVNNVFSADSLVYATSTAPYGRHSLNYLYLIDASDPTQPQGWGAYYTGLEQVTALQVSGSYVYLVNLGTLYSAGEFQIINASDPHNISLSGQLTSSDQFGYFTGVRLSEGHAFVTEKNDSAGHGLRVVDTSDPTSPRLVGSLATDGIPLGLALSGSHAFVATYRASGLAGLDVVDVSDPAAPVLLGRTDLCPIDCSKLSLDVSGRFVYLALGSEAGLQVVDVIDPSRPILASSLDTGGEALQIQIAPALGFVADGQAGVTIVDISTCLEE